MALATPILPDNTPAYSAHSKGLESPCHLGSSLQQRPLLRSGGVEITMIEAKQRMYTQIQTQLYPDIEF